MAEPDRLGQVLQFVAPTLLKLMGAGFGGIGAGKERRLQAQLSRERMYSADLSSRRDLAAGLETGRFEERKKNRKKSNIRRAMARGLAGHAIINGLPGEQFPGAEEINKTTDEITSIQDQLRRQQ